MNYKIIKDGSFSSIKIVLKNGEDIKADQNSVVVMDGNVKLEAHIDSGILKSLYRKMCNESFFFQRLSVPENETGNVLLASKKLGDLYCIKLKKNDVYIIQKDGFLSAEKSVEISMKIQSLIKGMFSGEGYFLIEASGEGNLIIDSFGKIIKFELTEGEELIVNNSHLVAWNSKLKYQIVQAGKGLISSYLSGGGFACKFTGPGDVYIQTHNIHRFSEWMESISTTKQ